MRRRSNTDESDEAMPAAGAEGLLVPPGPQLRLRKVKSTSRAEEIVTEEEKQRRIQPDKPIHRPRDSIFSWSRSAGQNFEGVMNWAFLLLTLGGIRLFLENLNKYGIRVSPRRWLDLLFGNIIGETGEYPTLYLLLYTNFVVVMTLFFEKLLAKRWIGSALGNTLHVVNIISLLIVPVVVINTKHRFIGPPRALLCSFHCVILFFKLFSYGFVNKWERDLLTKGKADGRKTCSSADSKTQQVNSCVILAITSICFLKIWSYVQVNSWCRSAARNNERNATARSPSLVDFSISLQARMRAAQKDSRLVQYPDNLSLGDIYYFWLAPTLCYELNFPKMERIRKLFLLRRVLEVIIGTNIVLGLIQQWIIPSVVNSLIPFSNMDIGKAAERLLKLAIPNHLIWLTWFYLNFHSFLNTLGEVLQFADREFYRDWWNANNILTFWKNWNLPVHRWCVRHLFKPILKNGYSVATAQIVVFLFSAFFHEYLVSVPLRVFKVYAFLGMAMQFPLIFVSAFLEEHLGPRAGNVCVWLSLIIGQPLATMMYYHDYVVEHYGAELISYYGQLETDSNVTAAVN